MPTWYALQWTDGDDRVWHHTMSFGSVGDARATRIKNISGGGHAVEGELDVASLDEIWRNSESAQMIDDLYRAMNMMRRPDARLVKTNGPRGPQWWITPGASIPK
jgi:hypothetical protein